MNQDTKFLYTTPLINFFNLTPQNDPFLMFPSKSSYESEQSNKKILLYISKGILNRIRTSEIVLIEETVQS